MSMIHTATRRNPIQAVSYPNTAERDIESNRIVSAPTARWIADMWADDSTPHLQELAIRGIVPDPVFALNEADSLKSDSYGLSESHAFELDALVVWTTALADARMRY